MSAAAFRWTLTVGCVAIGAWAGAMVARRHRPPDLLPIDAACIARFVQDGEARGSATLVRDRRTAVTCDHVLTDSDRCVLEFAGPVEIGATVVERGKADDVAILRLDADAPAAPRPLATSVPAAGATLSLCTRWDGATTPMPGTVATPARDCWTLPGLDEYAEYLIIDRPGVPGTSGSAWVDESGALVGIQDAIVNLTGPPARQLSGVVPVAVVAARLNNAPIVRGSLRVGLMPTSLLRRDPPETAYPPGLMITSLRLEPQTLGAGGSHDMSAAIRASPLLHAEVLPGSIITAIDGAPVSSLDDWWARISTRPPGTTVTLSYVDLTAGVKEVRVVTVEPRARAR